MDELQELREEKALEKEFEKNKEDICFILKCIRKYGAYFTEELIDEILNNKDKIEEIISKLKNERGM